jgi:hypothetical protein
MSGLAGWVIYGTLSLAFVLMGLLALVNSSQLSRRLGPVNWDFSTSWASTFTVLGAFLGTVLGESGVVPETTYYLPKAAYGGLNLLFGLMALLAPLLYTALRTTNSSGTRAGVKEPPYRGYVWTFLLSSALTFWAVLGELATVGLLLAEIQRAGAIPSSVIVLLKVLGAISVVLVSAYVLEGSLWIIRYQSEPAPAKGGAKPAPALAPNSQLEPASASWNLF